MAYCTASPSRSFAVKADNTVTLRLRAGGKEGRRLAAQSDRAQLSHPPLSSSVYQNYHPNMKR
jgi:hypothetical protein